MNPTRRTFLGTGSSILIAGGLLAKAPAGGWKNHIGLELYTVRDLLAKDFEGTMAKVAEIGYKEVEPVGYGGLDPKQFRALLDRFELTAPSTHAGVTAGPDLEKQLEGQQAMGILYTEVHPAPAPHRAPSRDTVESVKRTAAELNENGKILKKFGMKVLVHNHTQEFEPFEDGKLHPYDILLAETDPSLVAMQLDIGWASVAGQNILEMFARNPGRFELWHVKDATGIKNIDPKLGPNDRRKATKLTTVGSGDIDYKAIFAKADLAGLKHFCIEQDNAAEGGADSMAAARTSFVSLKKTLS
jgi:sugar phosphate isomerase/epimerase